MGKIKSFEEIYDLSKEIGDDDSILSSPKYEYLDDILDDILDDLKKSKEFEEIYLKSLQLDESKKYDFKNELNLIDQRIGSLSKVINNKYSKELAELKNKRAENRINKLQNELDNGGINWKEENKKELYINYIKRELKDIKEMNNNLQQLSELTNKRQELIEKLLIILSGNNLLNQGEINEIGSHTSL